MIKKETCPYCKGKKIRCIRNEVIVIDNFHKLNKEWLADLYRCKTCGKKFVIGFGATPLKNIKKKWKRI